MADQVEGLRAVAAQTGNLLDLSRVAIFGWSYGSSSASSPPLPLLFTQAFADRVLSGGYVSLLALAQRPDVYKVGYGSRAAVAAGGRGVRESGRERRERDTVGNEGVRGE